MSRGRQLAEEALALTRRMLSLAQAGDWDGVAGAIGARDAALMQLFAGVSDAAQLLGVEATLRAVAANNAEIIALGRESRDDIGARLHALTRGRRAAARYQSTDRF